MRSVLKKLLFYVTHVQVLSVLLAFALMVFFSYYYMSGIERKHLLNNVNNAFLNTQTQITADLMEPETALGVIAENVRNMIMRGFDADVVHDYLFDTANYLTTDERLMYITTVYGCFDVFGGLFLSGIDWMPPENFIPQERPWYIAAAEANGKVAVTEPYDNLMLGITTLTFARQIFDDDGSPLGVVCFDVMLDRIKEYAINTSVTEGGYGILFDKNFNVLAHPIPRYLGLNLELMNDGKAIKEALLQTGSISERKVWDYNRNESVGFFKQLNNGWYLGIIAYANKYYQSVRDIGTILVLLGALLASVLIAILLSIVSEKKKAEERTRIMLDSVPVSASFWDNNYKIIDCNQEAVNLFGLSGKKEYLDRFFELSPENQQDGTPSSEYVVNALKKAFDEGYHRFEWTHQRLNGEQIPSEVTLVRVKFRNENIICGYTRDLREINAAIAKLREVDERNMLMLDGAPLGVSMWDENHQLVDFNYEAARVIGIHNKDEYRLMFFDTLPEYQSDGRKSADVMADFINTSFRKGSAHITLNQNSIDGETIPFDALGIRLVLRDDPVVVVYTHDLRELNKAYAEIREADEYRQALFDTSPLGCCMLKSSLEALECNQELLRIFDLTDKNEFLNRFSELSPEYQPSGELSQKKIREMTDKALEEGSCNFEWTHRKFNGELIPCEVTLFAIMFRNEKVVCGYIRDLRELKSIMAKMREADECTKVMFDATPLCCIMIDKKINVIDCNQEITRLFGLNDKREYIDHIYNFFPEYQPSGQLSKDYFSRQIDEAFEEGYCRFEIMHQKLDGEQLPTEVALVRVKFRGEYAVAGYIRDLRELKSMIAGMRRAEIAEESSKAKSDFLAKMSHEIRTPMNAILGITEIQLQDNSLTLGTREALERIYNSGDLLLGIINDILDLSKIEAGKLELVSNLYDIASLIHDTVKLNIMRYDSKPIEFKLTVSENVPSRLVGDELRIKQILNNLLSNSFKYTQEGQVELMLSAEMMKNGTSVNLIIRVSDTGQGMTDEQVKKLGEKFNRFNMEANRNTEGTGLGMNITRNLIQLMNGEIFIESTPGIGSVFTVRLPQECADSTPIGVELAENLMKLNLKNTTKMRNAQITQEFMPYGRVLIVDDVETNLYVARGLMAPYGLSLDTAISGFEAIDKINAGSRYDIIFMDHMMPKMDGIEATKLIRSLGYKQPIVALTANALAGQAEMFLKNGFDDFISKPIDIRQLNSVLNKMIRDKQTPEALDEARKQKHSLYAAGRHNIAVDSQLAEIFIRDAQKTIGVLEAINNNNCSRSDDVASFIINVHSMKSALANIGEKELSGKAMELEQAGRDQNIDLILSNLQGFIKSLQQVVDKLKPIMEDTAENESEATDEFDRAFLQEKLSAFQEACSSMDKKAAKEALSSLKQKTWPRFIKGQLSIIAEHLLHSEFDEAAAMTKDIFIK
ncbi:MAG: ATP-binding protein [Treponema sp.]|nr:ATP-binding protein [Treponema sp.]